MSNLAPQKVWGSYLRDYQRRLLADQSRKIMVLKARRIGMSEAGVWMGLLEALSTSYHDVYLCSTSYTNAKELLRRTRTRIKQLEDTGFALPVAENKKTELVFKNGSRIIPMPAKKVRSRGGTIILDELAHYQWDEEVWEAVRPTIDTGTGNNRLVVITTPFGASGVAWRLWEDPKGRYDDWSRYKIDVYQAAKEGFPVDPDELRSQYAPDVWRQEFCCEFIDDIDQYFPHDLIRRMQYSPVDLEDGIPSGERYAGLDWGSRQDASELADLVAARHPSTGRDLRTFWVRHIEQIKEAGQQRDYTAQHRDARSYLNRHDWDAIASDATGEGAQVSQDLAKDFGARVSQVKGATWSDVRGMIPDLRLSAESSRFRIPQDTPRLRNAFTQITRKDSGNGPTFKAQRNDQGHADAFFAVLLGYYAAHDDSGGWVGGWA